MKVVNIAKKRGQSTNCIVSFAEDSGEIIKLELAMDIVIKEQLTKDKTINDSHWQALKATNRLLGAKQAGYLYAAKANKTKKQVAQKLQQKGFQSAEIEATLRFLQEFKLLDDAVFAKKYIKDKLLVKNIGKFGLQKKLLALGIEPNTAEQAIEAHFPKQTEIMLLSVVQKQLRKLARKNLSNDKLKQAIYNHIVAKGFTFAEAKSVVENLDKYINESDTI